MSSSHTGYAWKRGNRRKTWKRRFFQLDQHGLYYFTNETKSVRKGGCRLDKLISVQKVSVQCPHSGWGLLIRWEGRDLFMQLAVEDEQLRWLSVICYVAGLPYDAEDVLNEEPEPVNVQVQQTKSFMFEESHSIQNIKTKLPSLFSSQSVAAKKEMDINTLRIHYATPLQIVYEVPEGPRLKNIESTVTKLLPSHMSVSFTATPLNRKEYFTEVEHSHWKDIESLVDKRKRIDNNNVLHCIKELMNEITILLKESNSLDTLNPEVVLPFYPNFSDTIKMKNIWNEFYDSYTHEMDNNNSMSKDEWYNCKWINIYCLLKSLTGKISKEMQSQLILAFSSCLWHEAYATARKIIDELPFNNMEKTILPVNDDEYPKCIYTHNGFNFNFVIPELCDIIDDNGIQKSLSQEFRATKWMETILKDVSSRVVIPLLFKVNYLGFTMLVSPCIPINNHSPIIYGTKGMNNFNSSPEISILTNQINHILPLKQSSRTQYDYKVYLGLDGRYYFNNLSRICAPESPILGYDKKRVKLILIIFIVIFRQPSSELYRFFRLEFLMAHEQVLNPNSFFTFTDDEFIGEDRQAIINALDLLLTFVIPRFVENISLSTYKLLIVGADTFLAYVSII